jgi:predicted nucleic acid-binding protein
MKKQKIYVDTSVIGGCFDDEFKKWSNGLFEDFKNKVFIPVVSEVTAAEILDSPRKVQKKYNELLKYNSEILKITAEVINLAAEYQKRKILTPKYFDDGLHIALAIIAEVDILVSWNFRHIVHFDKIRMFNSIHLEFGYKSIEIYSPREVSTYED